MIKIINLVIFRLMNLQKNKFMLELVTVGGCI